MYRIVSQNIFNSDHLSTPAIYHCTYLRYNYRDDDIIIELINVLSKLGMYCTEQIIYVRSLNSFCLVLACNPVPQQKMLIIFSTYVIFLILISNNHQFQQQHLFQRYNLRIKKIYFLNLKYATIISKTIKSSMNGKKDV